MFIESIDPTIRRSDDPIPTIRAFLQIFGSWDHRIVSFGSSTDPDHYDRSSIDINDQRYAKNQLKTVITQFPNLSIRKAASAVGVSPTLVFSILHNDLHLKPYKFHEWHKLEPQDYDKRVAFAQWFLSLPPGTELFLICSDEAYFYLTLPVNKQNIRVWAESQPHEGVEIPLHDQKILVFCAISASKVYGVYYFENSVNQHNYLNMLKTFFWPKHLRTIDYKKYYFQQDGATPHTADIVQEWLSGKFSEKFIDKKKWPPRSPDLNPCDFFYGDI